MFYFERFIISFLGSFKEFYQRKYIIGENHFIRNRKIGFKEIVLYILTNKGRTSSVEAFDYYTKILKNDFETISSQAIGK